MLARTNSVHLWWWWLLPALLLSRAPTARADDATDRANSARALFERAETHFSVGELRPALRLYKKAYKTDPLPAFLFNIGQCHRYLGEHEQAIHAYRQFLRRAPGTKHRTTVEKLIRVSEEALAKQRAGETPEPKAPHSRPSDVDNEQLQRQIAALNRELREVQERERKRAQSPPFYKRWWFWTAVGVVVTGAAVATTVVMTQPDDPVVGNGPPGVFRLP